MARVTDPRSLLIVAHGSPSAPAGPERALHALAEAVAAGLPGWRVRGATLAAPGSLEGALEMLPDPAPLVFPFFMADGWFVRHKLPQRLSACGREAAAFLPPLGLNPALQSLCLEAARDGAAAAGYVAAQTGLLLAAHGSSHDPGPRRAALAAADSVAAARVFREVHVGFVEEEPFLAEAARLDAPALCLPFFAARAGHVEIDLPRAFAEAAFDGPQLAPIGEHPGVAKILQDAVRDATTGRATHRLSTMQAKDGLAAVPR